MNRGDNAIKITTAALLITMLGYLGLWLHELINRETVVPAVQDSYQQTISLSGIILREETALKSSRTYASVSTARSRRVAAGAVLGLGYDSEAELLRARRVDSLTREIAATESVLSELTGEVDQAERAEAARSAVLSLCADSARHDISSLRSDTLRIRAAVFEDGAAISQSELEKLYAELAELRTEEDYTGTDILTAPAAGLFAAELDGWEKLGPVLADNLTVSSLRPLLSYKSTVDRRAYGKLITGYEWTFAALADQEEAACLIPGSAVTLDLTAYRAGRPQMTVISVSEPEDGVCAVNLRTDRGLTDTASLRRVSCTAVTGEISALRIPESAVRVDERYGPCVYTDPGDGPLLIPVTVLHRGEQEALISSPLLHAGDNVLLRRGFYKGKLLK